MGVYVEGVEIGPHHMTNYAICLIPSADIQSGATMAFDYQPEVIQVLPVRQAAQRRADNWNAEEENSVYFVARTPLAVTDWYFD